MKCKKCDSEVLYEETRELTKEQSSVQKYIDMKTYYRFIRDDKLWEEYKKKIDDRIYSQCFIVCSICGYEYNKLSKYAPNFRKM